MVGMKPYPVHQATGSAKSPPTALGLVAIILIGWFVIGVLQPTSVEAAMEFTLQSSAFSPGDAIPSRYTCEGRDISPPLSWRGVPEGARSLVLIVDDPDAPDPRAPKMTWVHWVLYNLPAELTALPENIAAADLPTGTGQGRNDWRRSGYGGPCPPVGRHRYFFKLYALDTRLSGLQQPTKAEVEAAMEGHVMARAELIGTYRKSD